MSKSLLPEKEYMLDELSKRLKLSKKKVLSKAKKYVKEKYPSRPELANNERLALFLFAFSNGIEFRVKTPLPAAEPKKIAELEVGQKNVEVLGYAVGIAERPTAKGTRQIIFTLVDDTGHVHSRVWGENALAMWEEAGIKEGDPILVTGAVVDELQVSGKTLKIFGQYVEVTKLDKDEINLPPLEEIGKAKISEVEEGKFVQVDGVVIRADVRTYVGCPECDSKLPCDLGESITCERCGSEVIATEREWKLLVVSDDTGEIGARVPPGVKSDVTIGDIVRLMGIYTDGVLRVISVRKEAATPLEAVAEPKVITVEEKEEEEEKVVETPEEVAEEAEEFIEITSEEEEEEEIAPTPEAELSPLEERIKSIIDTYGGVLGIGELKGILREYKEEEIVKTLEEMKNKGIIQMDEREVWIP